MSKLRIFIIEDSPDLQAILRLELENDYEVVSALTLAEAERKLAQEKFDLTLLDVTLPDGSGFDFCERLRKQPELRSMPIIFLTGKNEPLDKRRGFALGADDYIAKPFEPVELRARIEARLRHAKELKHSDPQQVIGRLRFDRLRLRVTFAERNQDLNLTPFEFRILYFLASNYGRIFSKAELLKNTLEANVHVNEENIYTHVSSLRRKLGDCAEELESIPKQGYRFRAPG